MTNNQKYVKKLFFVPLIIFLIVISSGFEIVWLRSKVKTLKLELQYIGDVKIKFILDQIFDYYKFKWIHISKI
jgi:hypothetical protein